MSDFDRAYRELTGLSRLYKLGYVGGPKKKDISVNTMRVLLKEQGGKCSYCKNPIDISNAHNDHIIPLSKGGAGDPRNIQLLCGPCNTDKSNKDPIEYMYSKGIMSESDYKILMGGLLIGRKEIASAIGIDATTLDRWCNAYPDLPVKRRGPILVANRLALLSWFQRGDNICPLDKGPCARIKTACIRK